VIGCLYFAAPGLGLLSFVAYLALHPRGFWTSVGVGIAVAIGLRGAIMLGTGDFRAAFESLGSLLKAAVGLVIGVVALLALILGIGLAYTYIWHAAAGIAAVGFCLGLAQGKGPRERAQQAATYAAVLPIVFFGAMWLLSVLGSVLEGLDSSGADACDRFRCR
jgi:hypothetical protein